MMQREFWVRADGSDAWEERKGLVKTALESGAQAVLVNVGEESLVNELGRIKVASKDENADIFLSEDIREIKKGRNSIAFYCEIKSKNDERRIAQAGQLANYVIINTRDWKIIPLENLIAELRGRCRILAEVHSAGEARVALETLEVGADGVIADCNPSEIRKIRNLIDSLSSERLGFNEVGITGAEEAGDMEAISIDTCSILNPGEGLIADEFLVHSDTEKTPWTEPTPFRISIDINSKIRTPDGIRTADRICPGDEILSANFEGRTRRLVVNETIPVRKRMIRVRADNSELKIPSDSGLVGKDGRKIPAGELKKGDRVLFLTRKI